LYREAQRAIGRPDGLPERPQPLESRKLAAPPDTPAQGRPPGRAPLAYRALAFILLAIALWIAFLLPVLVVGGLLATAAEGGPLEDLVKSVQVGAWLLVPIVVAFLIAQDPASSRGHAAARLLPHPRLPGRIGGAQETMKNG